MKNRILLLIALMAFTLSSFSQVRTISSKLRVKQHPEAVPTDTILAINSDNIYVKTDKTVADIGSGGGSQNLQQVTDIGNITSNDLRILGNSTSLLQITDVINSVTSAYYVDRLFYGRDGFGLTIQTPTLTDNRIINWQDGNGTVAFLSDVSGNVGTLQTVTDNGEITTNNLKVSGGTNSALLIDSPDFSFDWKITDYFDEFSISKSSNNIPLFSIQQDGSIYFDEDDSTRFLSYDAGSDVLQVPELKYFRVGSPTTGLSFRSNQIYPTLEVESPTGMLIRHEQGLSNTYLEISDNGLSISTGGNSGTPRVQISASGITTTRSQQLPDKDGVFAMLSDIPGGGSGGDITKVTNVTALRAFTVAPTDGDLFILEGHTIQGFGGGLFQWQSTNTDTDDNGSIIQATTIPTGRFVRVVENRTVSIEDFGGIADTNDNTTDDSIPFLNAIDYLVNNQGGTLIIPNRSNFRFYITNQDNLVIRNYSDIVIKGGGSIYIDHENSNVGLVQGRGTLVKIGNTTDNFQMMDLDILVSEGTFANNFINGVICQEELGSWSNLYFKRLKIHSEARPDTQTGNHGITFHRDTTNPLDDAKAFNLTIEECDIYLTGQSIYGIHMLRDVENIKIDNNEIELTAWTTDANDAYNAIAIYGDSKNFSVTSNTVYSSGHSAIAASMAENGVIAFNRVYNVSIINEAGIEVEYKEGHGTNLTDPDFQTKAVKVHNNYVEACHWGIAVVTREVFNSIPTQVPPIDTIISNNTVRDSESVDIIVASNVSGTPDYTLRIKDVIIDGNNLESSATGANIYIYDSDGAKIINNICRGGDENLHIGRSTTIFPIGNFDIINNDFYNNSGPTSSIQLESTGDNCVFRIKDNDIYPTAGTRGIAVLSLIGTNNLFIVESNTVTGGTDGFRFTPGASNIQYSSFKGNYAYDCTARGFQISSDNGTVKDNYAINCTTANTIGGTSVVTDNNQEL